MFDALFATLQHHKPLTEADRQLITSAFKPAAFKEDEALFSGGISRELYFINMGIVRILTTDEKGRSNIHFFLREGQFCTVLDSFLNQVITPTIIQATCELEALCISRDGLFRIFEESPYLKELINNILQQQMIGKVNLRNIYLNQDAATRYDLFLRQQADIALRVKLQDVASYLGITPQSLSRLRKQVG